MNATMTANLNSILSGLPCEAPKLTKPMRQVLTALSRAKDLLTRRTIAERTEAYGESLILCRIADETKTYAALDDMGYITSKEFDIVGLKETAYRVTEDGRTALREWNAANKE